MDNETFYSCGGGKNLKFNNLPKWNDFNGSTFLKFQSLMQSLRAGCYKDIDSHSQNIERG